MTATQRQRFPLYFSVVLLGLLALVGIFRQEEATSVQALDKLVEKAQPEDWFFMQRTVPGEKFGLKAYESAIKEALQDRKEKLATSRGGVSWVVEGPGNIGGRINTVEIDPADNNIFYVGSTAGGVFKTTDAGANWLPIFDDQPYLAIGEIEIDPTNSNTIYVGTGDPNISGYPKIGDGIYKSTDAGATWTNVGLIDERVISRIEVHPLNPNIIYAGAMGLPFEKNSNRGLYKSTDGGATWTQSLYINDSTGVIDMLIDPTNPDIVYAATWNRIRNNSSSLVEGPDARIYKTVDGGANWTMLTGGLPNAIHSRIGLAMDPASPSTIYAEVVEFITGVGYDVAGIYKSTDGGSSWSALPTAPLVGALGGFGWYFAKIRVNPYAPNRLYVLGVDLSYSDDGGNTWSMLGPPWWTYEVHADKHDLKFISADSWLLTTDGGVYRTDNNGATWTDIEDIPVTQFYHVQVNPHIPNDYWGGAQDNGTTSGNLSTFNFWERNYGGDGFHIEFHPDDPNIVFAETQNGGIVRSTDGGFSFFDFTAGINFADRRSWDMPFIISPHDPSKMYCGTYRLYEHPASAPSDWAATTGDLTDGIDSRYNVISTIRESYVTPGILYVGASDGHLSRSEDGGSSWDNIQAGLPDRYVTDVETSHLDDQIVFVSHSGYRDNDFIPHIHMSTDRGDNWVDISGDLPQLAINDLEVYPGNDSIIFVATDGGVYFTLDQGLDWERLGDDMPVVLVYDIEFDHHNGKLVAGTFARSAQTLELSSIVPPQFQNVGISEDASICQGESVLMEASGGFTYSWTPTTDLSCSDCPNPTASPSATTTYTVEIGDCLGHTTTRDITITVGAGLSAPVVDLVNDTLFSSVVGAAGYQWSQGGSDILGANDYFYKPPGGGLYAVTIVNADGCEKTSDPFNYVISGLGEIEITDFSLYPNPAVEQIQVKFEATALPDGYRIYRTDGSLVQQAEVDSRQMILDLSELSVGTYIFALQKNGRELLTRNFVKK